jgi:hypothetical protein
MLHYPLLLCNTLDDFGSVLAIHMNGKEFIISNLMSNQICDHPFSRKLIYCELVKPMYERKAYNHLRVSTVKLSEYIAL